MDFFDVVTTQRAMRRLKTDAIPDDVLKKIMDTAICAPSGGNRQNWSFVVVRDQARRARLGELYREAWGELMKVPYYAGATKEPADSPAGKMLASARHLGEHLGEAPVIAAVNGAAAGAGMNLALGCDIRLASTAAKFTQAFVKRGLHPDWGGTYFLPRLVGMAKACELIFTGEIIDAQEALRLGIVNAVYAPEELMPAAYELARKIASGPPVAIRLAKRALYHSEETDLRGALEFETFAQNVCSETEDAREGIRAFVEKRAPSFKGR